MTIVVSYSSSSPTTAIVTPHTRGRISSSFSSSSSSSSSSIRLLFHRKPLVSTSLPLFLPRPISTSPIVRCSSSSSSSSSSAAPVMDGSLTSSMFPLHRCKTLHLVRHAQGTHNVEGEKDYTAYLSQKHFDAHLTPLGWEQVDNLRKHVQSSGLSKKIDLVIVSPLLRTMQTAVGVFGGDGYANGINSLPLMVANAGRSDRLAISSLNCPPFLAVEKCREHLGVHPCDRRRSIFEYQQLFPAIDFSLIESDDDILWTDKVREEDADVAARGVEFMNWLWTRKEKEIAIVTHSGFLYHTLKRFATHCQPLMQEEIGKHFSNCELRSMTLVDTGVRGSDSSSTNYRGKIPL